LRAGEKLVLEDNIVVQKVLHASAGDPGASISAQAAKEFAAGLKNCRFIDLGQGAHYPQEDHPDTIGKAIAGSLPQIVRTESPAEPA